MAQGRKRRRTKRASNRETAFIPAETEFLNIDLEVRSRHSLTPLAEAWPWAQRPRALNGRTNTRWLILSARGTVTTADAAAKALLEHIRCLPPKARRCWNAASTRTFDIGMQAGVRPSAFEQVLTADIVRRISSVGARVKLTVYAAQAG
jgi:hypothetical protein